MTENPFYRLAPFIQEYIYRKGWKELRGIQVQAIPLILDTDQHLLITSGTASGKTEAALLPILTSLYFQPASSIGVLYIGPLKALINDQFERLQGLLEESDIPVQSWHGDVAQSKKQNFLKRAQGILQITPESMEAMLINRQTDLKRLFGDLRFVVLDEVHAFISSDRGRQVMCQLQRLARYQTRPVRRIGLSATLGEPDLAMSWLAGGTNTPVALIDDKQTRRDVQLGLEHFLIRSDEKQPGEKAESQETDEETSALTELDSTGDYGFPADILANGESLYRHVYQMCCNAHKTLIFANQRAEVEETAANLRALAAQNHTPDIYHVHHGSIAAPLREAAEAAMRSAEKPACVAATVTLELGIDIGQLDQVLQINATHSVSSFVQRLGRSGRRGTPARMFFYSREEEPDAKATLGERIPWNLLQTIAIIQLYIEEKWVEPPQIPYLPFSLLYHQTMSTLLAATELSPPQLAERILTLSPFSAVLPDYYQIFLRHLIQTKHLELTEIGTLIVGLEGEKIVNNYRFYATFEDERGVRVLAQSREIGTISSIPEVDTSIRLAGYTWRVITVDTEQKVVNVQRARGKSKTIWAGGGVEIHTRVIQGIHRVLQSETHYPYLLPQARKRLDQARSLTDSTGLVRESILLSAPNRYILLPWRGTRTVDTLELLLQHDGFAVSTHTPFYLEISKSPDTVEQVRKRLSKLANAIPEPSAIVEKLPGYELQKDKYDRFVPDSLLREAYIKDRLDLVQAAASLQEIVGK